MATTKAKTPGRTIDDFQKEHDQSYIVPARINAGLAELGDTWEYEIDFQKRIGCNANMLSRYRDQFADYIVDVQRRPGRSHSTRAWAGTKKTADKLREMTAR